MLSDFYAMTWKRSLTPHWNKDINRIDETKIKKEREKKLKDIGREEETTSYCTLNFFYDFSPALLERFKFFVFSFVFFKYMNKLSFTTELHIAVMR